MFITAGPMIKAVCGGSARTRSIFAKRHSSAGRSASHAAASVQRFGCAAACSALARLLAAPACVRLLCPSATFARWALYGAARCSARALRGCPGRAAEATRQGARCTLARSAPQFGSENTFSREHLLDSPLCSCRSSYMYEFGSCK